MMNDNGIPTTGRLATAVRFGNRLAPLVGRHLTGQKGLGRPLQCDIYDVAAACDLRPAACDLRPATCDLRPATCGLRTPIYTLGPAWMISSGMSGYLVLKFS